MTVDYGGQCDYCRRTITSPVFEVERWDHTGTPQRWRFCGQCTMTPVENWRACVTLAARERTA